MGARRRVLVAMSGGVDSAVAAARLVDQGHDVVGVTLHLWDYGDRVDDDKGRCCAPEDQYDARRTADALAIPHFTFDRRELFAREVVSPFIESYLGGTTPSPCAACNRTVKLRELEGIADRLGASHIATGHYARTARDAAGRTRIARGVDESKDQSYFLYATHQSLVERMVFPLGESRKAEVRAEAIGRELPGATKGESQELCFVGAQAGAYARFVEERARERVRPGFIVDAEGRRLRAHDGIHQFTIGQRRGLGVSIGQPAFVSRIDPDTGDVVVDSADAIASAGAKLTDVVGDDLPEAFDATIRVRYRHEGARGHVTVASRAKTIVSFDEPVRAVASGQIAVFYETVTRGDAPPMEIVLGGGRIDRAFTESELGTLSADARATRKRA